MKKLVKSLQRRLYRAVCLIFLVEFGPENHSVTLGSLWGILPLTKLAEKNPEQ